MKKKALMIISSADRLPLKIPANMEVSIGFFIVEMGKVLEVFSENYDFTFVTPDGNIPTIDINGESLVMQTSEKFLFESAKLTTQLKLESNLSEFRSKNEEYVKRRRDELKLVGNLLGKLKISQPLQNSNIEAEDYREEIVKYMNTLEEKEFLSLKQVIEKDNDKNDSFNIKDFDFVHIPGGHAPMVDFLDNPYLGEVLNRIYENNILLSIICHGPIALSSAKYRVDSQWNTIELDDYGYKGAHITVFGKAEELQVSIGGFYKVEGEKTRLEYYVSEKLESDGYKVDTSAMFLPKVIWDEDKKLITGNGPEAIDELTNKLKELILTYFSQKS